MRSWIAILVVVLLPGKLHSQEIGAGVWPATLEFPDGDSVKVTFEVTRPAGKLLIDVRAANGTVWGLRDPREERGRLRFSWSIDGPRPLLCSLSGRDDGRWEGVCEDNVPAAAGRVRIVVTLHPRKPGTT